MSRDQTYTGVVMENYKYKCANCEELATTIHHIVPVSLGGRDTPSNMVALCEICHG